MAVLANLGFQRRSPEQLGGRSFPARAENLAVQWREIDARVLGP